MRIEYALSRAEVVRGYLYGWVYSSTVRWHMLSAAFVFGVLMVGQRWLATGAVQAGDLSTAAFWGGGLLIFLPLWFALRLKRQKRILELSARGIQMAVGDVTLDVPWSGLAAVVDANEFVIISRRNMNSLYIPKRAFADNSERAQFVENANANLARARASAG